MSRIVADDGIGIAYSRHPGPDPVLLVHGFASNSDLNWDATGWVRALAEADRGSVRVDLRGHGATDAPHDAAAYSPARLAADLVAVLDAEGLECVDVIGYSMGARVARVLEAEHPGQVRRMLLAGIGSREQFSAWGVEALQGALLRGESLDDPDAVGLIQALRSAPGVDLEAVAACVAGMAGHPLDHVPACPTLVVAGEADTVARDAADFARTLGAEYVPIPKRNHLNTVSARTFKRAALAFLAE